MNAPRPNLTERQGARKGSPLGLAARIGAWVLGVPLVLLLALYLVLLATPVPLPFGNAAVRALVMANLPETSDLELGAVALAVENGAPVLRFSPVTLSDSRTGSRIGMEALEIGFSPLRALVGQPGANVTVVGPQIQIVQDLFGPRITRFELVEDPEGGQATVRVMEGLEALPSVDISGQGIALGGVFAGGGPAGLRSDNDWLILNLEASEAALAQVVEHAAHGRFARLTVREGSIGMTDSVYGLYRRFENVTLDLRAGADGTLIEGTFSARLAGRIVSGGLQRRVMEDGGAILEADIVNLDFSSVVPFIDDPDSIFAMRGAGAVSVKVGFAAGTGAVTEGRFRVDMTGMDLRLKDDFFPVASSILDIGWDPQEGRFTMEEGAIRVGGSSAYVRGVFALGLDPLYGPTVSMSVQARDVLVEPYDMAPAASPFEHMQFSGWAAPIYGAMGIDKWVVVRDGGVMEAQGRIDMLRAGIGIDLAVAARGVTADDFKRFWPYVMAGESRDWFVANITEGRVKESSMRFRFPVGSIAIGVDDGRPMPEGAMQVDIVGEGVAIRPAEGMDPIVLAGDMVMRLRDSDFSVAAGGGVVPTEAGPVTVRGPALVMESAPGSPSIVEISGDIEAGIPALLALVSQFDPEALETADLPLDIASITGSVDIGVLATIRLEDAAAGLPMQLDYVLSGEVAGLGSAEPVMGRRFSGGRLDFSASNAGFHVAGRADVDGLSVDIEAEGLPEEEPSFRLASSVRPADLLAFGVDVSGFFSGEARLVAEPRLDGSLDIAVDLRQAGLDIADLGLSKAPGAPGMLSARLTQAGEMIELRDVVLAFGEVRIAGGLSVHARDGLRVAEITELRLSPGDDARLVVRPISGGYDIAMSGRQFDLRPMLRRFFDLDEGAGGVGTEQLGQSLALDISLERAIGFYGTTAFNVDLDLALAGSDLERANVSAVFAEGNALSITTNPTPQGRVMSMAFNDAGTILRLLGVYSQLAGGAGSLVLNRNAVEDYEVGELLLENFAIVDEAVVAQVLGNHADSRAVIADRNRLDFDAARVSFTRRGPRIEVTDGILSGDTVGGTVRGYIHTDPRQYDLTGTYVPLFGLNNAFQQIPLFGPLLGGRDGEGLVGVTFAVRGPLDDPQFHINPLSALVPGAFRELFEFRTQGQ